MAVAVFVVVFVAALLSAKILTSVHHIERFLWRWVRTADEHLIGVRIVSALFRFVSDRIGVRETEQSPTAVDGQTVAAWQCIRRRMVSTWVRVIVGSFAVRIVVVVVWGPTRYKRIAQCLLQIIRSTTTT